MRHGGMVNAMAFSPDSRRVLTACLGFRGRRSGTEYVEELPGMTQLWEADTGKPVGSPLFHPGRVDALAFGPDGRTILIGGVYGELAGVAQLRDAVTGQPLGPPLLHRSPVSDVGFGPDGNTILTYSDLDGLRVWEAATGNLLREPLKNERVVFSPDRRSVADLGDRRSDAALGRHNVQLHDPFTGEPLGPPLSFYPRLRLAFANGRCVLIADADSFKGEVQVWDAMTGEPLGPPLKSFGLVRSASLAHSKYKIALNTIIENEKIFMLESLLDQPLKGNYLPSQKSRSEVRLWDLFTAQPIGLPLRHRSSVGAVSFSPDDRTILTVSGLVRLWDLEASAGRLLEHQESVGGMARSETPDGKITLVELGEGSIQLLEVSTGRALGPPLRHPGGSKIYALSPDGLSAVTAGQDHTVRLWDATTGLPLGPPLEHRIAIRAVAFRSDNRGVLTECEDKTVRLWEVPCPMKGSVARVVLWVQICTGMEIDDSRVSFKEHGINLKRLESLGGPPIRR
jgi:WD40 repeat protein